MKKWTAEELETLHEPITSAEAGRILGRTAASVQLKRQRLKIKSDDRPKAPTKPPAKPALKLSRNTQKPYLDARNAKAVKAQKCDACLHGAVVRDLDTGKRVKGTRCLECGTPISEPRSRARSSRVVEPALRAAA